MFLSSKTDGLPIGIVVDIEVECGESISEVANVTFLTDVDYIQAVALCENNTEVNLTPSDDFRSVISINYPGGPDMGCQFKRSYPGVEVYSVTIEVAHDVNGTLIQSSDDVYSLTCSFGDELDGEASDRTIDDSLVPANSVVDIKAPTMTSNLVLDVVAFDGSVFTSAIPIGKIVRLKGTLSVSANETAPRAFSCQALSSNYVESYELLIGGCGDGRVFPKNYGFTTFGNIAFSPYFKAFRMKGDDRIKFKCQFTACQRPGGCNGTSCFKSVL